jgi:hypothetical protein
LKHRVQNNVLEVEKLKGVQKSNFLKNTLPCAIGKRTTKIYLCCAFSYGTWQTYIFAVCFPMAHDKENVFAVRLVPTKATDNVIEVTFGGKKMFAVR